MTSDLDKLIERAKRLTGLKTKQSVIEEAVNRLIQNEEQAQVRSLRGTLDWEGDLERLRQSRSEDRGQEDHVQ